MIAEPIDKLQNTLSLSECPFADAELLILPENIQYADSVSDFKDAIDGINLAKYLKHQGYACKIAHDFGCSPKILERRGSDIWLGLLWFASGVAVNVAGDFIYAWLSNARSGEPTDRVHVELKIQDGKTTSSIKFDGTADNFELVLAGLQRKEA